ncbi:MAG: VWA domain-containing protein [Candidatus Methylomirabilia bacterium]
MLIRYSRWDGTQDIPEFDADDLLGAMSDDLLYHGDSWSALRRLLQRGLQPAEGRRVRGLQDLLNELRRRRQRELDRYDLGSSLEDIRQKLDQVVQTERDGLHTRLAEGHERREREEWLDRLPPDPAGRIRELQDYDFVDPEARRLFEELLASLRQQVLQPLFQGMQQTLRDLTPEDRRRLREMLRDLNRTLRERAEGGEPDFERFRQKWGQHFPGVESLDQLIEHLARQSAQMQSLLQSLSPEQQHQLDELMRSLFLQDEQLEAALAQLAMHLNELDGFDELVQRYPFRGDEDLTLQQAMELMEHLREIDELERDLRSVRGLADLKRIEPEQVERLLGEEAARDLERLRKLAGQLEEAGYLERHGEELQLTARAIRTIADKALSEIFARLKRDRFGGHVIPHRGAGGDQMDETKPYEFGDPFLVDLKQTVMNAVERQGPGVPVHLCPEDFDVHRTELRTQSATVVMLDMSRSMLHNGYFLPAKKVALALSALIRGQFPRDALQIVGFSLYAREFTPDQLPTLSWSEWNVGTNMHAGLLLSRQLLARHRGHNRQIIMITDGEPTAHLEGEVSDFAYPPTRRTIEETLKEVRRCTREGIAINTFMLERTPWLAGFVEEMTRINRGRAFFAVPEHLGEYVVVDYVSSRRRVLR